MGTPSCLVNEEDEEGVGLSPLLGVAEGSVSHWCWCWCQLCTTSLARLQRGEGLCAPGTPRCGAGGARWGSVPTWCWQHAPLPADCPPWHVQHWQGAGRGREAVCGSGRAMHPPTSSRARPGPHLAPAWWPDPAGEPPALPPVPAAAPSYFGNGQQRWRGCQPAAGSSPGQAGTQPPIRSSNGQTLLLSWPRRGGCTAVRVALALRRA